MMSSINKNCIQNYAYCTFKLAGLYGSHEWNITVPFLSKMFYFSFQKYMHMKDFIKVYTYC